jgi:hypothetical protein
MVARDPDHRVLRADATDTHTVYGKVEVTRYRGYSIFVIPIGQDKGKYQASRFGLSIGEPVSSEAAAQANADKDLEKRNKNKGYK